MYDKVVKLFNDIPDGGVQKKIIIIAKATGIPHKKVEELLYRAGKRGDIHKSRQVNTFYRPGSMADVQNRFNARRVYNAINKLSKMEDCSFEAICSCLTLKAEKIGTALSDLCKQGEIAYKDGRFFISAK